METKEPHWKTRVAYSKTSYPFYNCTCSECGYTVPTVFDEFKSKCPKCGVEMKEEETNDQR